MNDLVGKSHTFEDGNSIKILQVKVRDENEVWVTYIVQQGPGIPQKLIMKQSDFVGHFGHLFNYKSDVIDNQ